MSRHFKVIATAIVVLLVLSGFSTARGGGSSGGGRGGSSGGKGGGKSGGGGCSSKKSRSHNNDGGDDGGNGSSGGNGGSSASKKPTGTVLACVSRTVEKAKVQIRTGGTGRTNVSVKLDFYGENNRRLDSATETFSLRNGVHTVEVPMTSPSKAAEVERCVLARVA